MQEEVFDEDGGTVGVAGGLVEAGGEGVGEGVAFGGVAGPAGGGVPAGAVAGGVDVEVDEEDVGGALGCADGVGAADAFFEGDVFGFRNEELGVVAFVLEVARIWLARLRV